MTEDATSIDGEISKLSCVRVAKKDGFFSIKATNTVA
ncbi:hypothetical protein CCACVL1_15426 [Corchorus capsularis]|uniref:Uncharacterized protein n=1 Tax=Corchorus capsularis TaxID=210143 RepID=A0A1R3I2F3_COCAP|nr:hypothetical protein CCACVL1_15426 [Corchorus capsularis]